MLSIIIPIFNAREYLEQTIQSVFVTTKSEFELILIDDLSDGPTREYVKTIEAPQIKLTKILNTEHRWTNYNWNLGAKLAQGEYIAILNSDIVLSQDWDTHLIEALKDHTISCPTEAGKPNLDPVIEKIDPKMIKGACFMFKKEDVEKLFPIPESIKHWCGDNILADRANGMQGVAFTEAVIRHFTTRSGRTIDRQIYLNRILADLEAYEKVSDRDMKLIKNNLSIDTLFSRA